MRRGEAFPVEALSGNDKKAYQPPLGLYETVDKGLFLHDVVLVLLVEETGRQCLLEVKHPTVTVTAIHCLHSCISARSELASTASQHQLGMAPAPTAAPQRDTACQGRTRQHSTLRQAQRPRCVAMPRPQLGRFTTKQQQHVLVPPSLEFGRSQEHSSCGSRQGRMQDTGGRCVNTVGVQPWVLRIGERTGNLIGDDA
ncbi:uncharacterized protein B0T23DRAFT_397763 [Neurospora hispaniola]|uniref:Uncharacterized protein n=1 Tax=Neurospora hispaniola TaxID=588809 RepID=A0AAJ0I3S2_9PEZI|nr:hypothetical protein B0T23DRAFT_397763 [Neurospora hispaniola]